MILISIIQTNRYILKIMGTTQSELSQKVQKTEELNNLSPASITTSAMTSCDFNSTPKHFYNEIYPYEKERVNESCDGNDFDMEEFEILVPISIENTLNTSQII